MLLVYRVENHWGEGPYYDQDYHKWACHDHDRSNKTPYFRPDYIPSYYVYGFNNLQQFYRWFYPVELPKLNKLDFMLGIYNAAACQLHVAEDDSQCMFNKANATLVRHVSLLTVHKVLKMKK